MRLSTDTSQFTLEQQAEYNRNITLSGWLNLQPVHSRRFSNAWRDGRMARRYREQVILKADLVLAMTVVTILYGHEEAGKSLFWRNLNKVGAGYLVLYRDTADKTKEGWNLAEELFTTLTDAKQFGVFDLCHFISDGSPARNSPITCRWSGTIDIAEFPNA